MWLGRTTLIVVALLAVLAGASTATAFVTTFDGMPAGSMYYPAQSLINGGGVFTVYDPLYNQQLSPDRAQVVNSNLAGGAANELLLYRTGLRFDSMPETGLSFLYANRGTGVGMTINGVTTSGTDFTTLDAPLVSGLPTVGGVQIFVMPGAATTGTKGAVFFIGQINSFVLGADQLYVDNIIASVPEPVTLSLLVLGGTLVARRKR